MVKKFALCFLSMLTLIFTTSVYGCGEEQIPTSLPKDIRLSTLQDRSLFQSDEITKSLDSASVECRNTVEMIFDKCELVNCTDNTDTVNITIKLVKLDSMLENLVSNKEVCTEYTNLKSLSTSNTEISDFIYTQINKIIATDSSNLEFEETNVTVEVTNGIISSNSFLSSYVQEIINAPSTFASNLDSAEVVNTALNTVIDENQEVVNIKKGQLQQIVLGETNQHVTLVITNVVTGYSAISTLSEINPANNFITAENAKIVVIAYKIVNTNQEDVKMTDNFVYFDEDNTIYKNANIDVKDITSDGVVASNSSRDFISVKIIPKEADSIYWYDRTNGQTLALPLALEGFKENEENTESIENGEAQ